MRNGMNEVASPRWGHNNEGTFFTPEYCFSSSKSGSCFEQRLTMTTPGQNAFMKSRVVGLDALNANGGSASAMVRVM